MDVVEFLKRRWLEFRWGHTIYLGFLLSMINFIVITYTLLIERIGFFKELFPRLSLYIIFFIIIYPPLAILMGYLHRKKQLKTEQFLIGMMNPYTMEILERLRKS